MSAGRKSTFAKSSLKIGDTVLLHFKLSSGGVAYVSSELSSSPFNFLTALPAKDGREKDPRFSNIFFEVFRTLVPNRYKASQNMKELQERNCTEYELANAKRAFDNEKSENVQEQARKLGMNVVYGDLVQFQHIASKKYITVCPEASKTESNNLLVNLNTDNSDGVIFRILPRYKVRSEGDIVHYDDEVKLESVRSPGQFLHVQSARNLGKAGYRLLSHCFEVNLSASESALSLIPHYSPSSMPSASFLRGGSCIRLFHKEDECYIVAEGSFASSSPVHEDVHCRLRRMDHINISLPSTSSNTYWQIEKVDSPTSGDVISWGESCRFKHMPTRMYLSVNSQFQVKLKHRSLEDEPDSDTLFSIHALSQEFSDEVMLGSYACIKHLLSGEWLHLEKKEKYVKNCVDPTAEGLAGLQWDSAELYKLKTHKEKGDYDCFILQEVSEELLDIFNYMAGIVPVLSSYIEMVDEDSRQMTESEAYCVRATLQEVKDWLITPSDRDTKNRQKTLRNLKVIEQLVEILRTGSKEHIRQSQKAICRECYNVIKHYLEGDSRKNENYLARYIELFQQHIRKGLNAEEVLVEIVQDNINIVSRMAETSLDSMIDQFCSTKDPRFLHFLSSLCVCNGRPIPSTQDRLLRCLVLTKGRELFLRVSVRHINDETIVFYHKPGGPKQKLRSLRKVQDPSEPQIIFELLEAQLYLFSRLCKGNNKESINSLLYDPKRNPNGYIDFDQALHVAKDDQIDITLRLRYAEIILAMFVDVGDNRSFLDNLCYTFIYDDIVAKPYADTGGDEGETIALTGVENENFPELKTWVLKTLEVHECLRSDTNSVLENELLEQVINVLAHLVRFGYYDDVDDVDECMKHLIKLLDGSTDLPSVGIEESKENVQIFKEKERKEDLPENKSVFSVKQKALEVMELFYRFKFYVKLQKFVYDFKVLNGEGRRTIKGSGKNDDDGNKVDPPRILSQLIAKTENEERLCQPHITRAALTRLQLICDVTEKGSGFAPQDDSIPVLETVLLDLSTYDCDELVTSSLNLLTQMYFFEEELFGKAVRVQLLTMPQSIQDFKMVNDIILPELRQLLRVDGNQVVQDRIIRLVDQLSELCFVTSQNQPGVIEPLEQYQAMLDNLGIMSEILSYVFSKAHGQTTYMPQNIENSSVDSVRVCEEVYISCLRFLKLLTVGQKAIQKRLFNCIDDLLELELPGNSHAYVAHLLTEVFTGHSELILKVSEQVVERIFQIIVDSHYSAVQAAFMNTLQAMAKIEEFDLPIGRNQAIIVKNFCRLRHTFCEEIIAEKERMDNKRMKILSQKEDTPLLEVLLSVTDLLATCAESGNAFVESVCQNIFSIEELLSIITQSNLKPSRKTPFVRFFIQVYLKQTGNQLVNEINHRKDVWAYLEQIAFLLNKVVKFFKFVCLEEKEKLARQLVVSSHKHSLDLQETTIYAEYKMSKKMAGITDVYGHVIPGIFDYIAGVIPLLHSFYCFYFNPLDANCSTDMEMEYKVSTLIVESLVQLREQLIHSCAPCNVTVYEKTIMKLLVHERIAINSGIDESTVFADVSVGSGNIVGTIAIMKSGADITSQADYQEQQKLNKTFTNYSENYRIVYRGKNTAFCQIHSSVQGLEYSELGEELPLGPSFQHLVSLYLTTSSVSKLSPEVEQLLHQLEISRTCSEHLSESEQIVFEVLDRRCLQVLRAMIVNQIKLIDPELKDRDPINFRQKFDQTVVPIQNQLQSFNNAISRIIPLLSHPNEGISQDALALTKTLLYSGNKLVQEGLCSTLQDTREETLFINLKQRIEIASMNFKEIKELKLQLLARKELHTSLNSRNDATDDHVEAAKTLAGVKRNHSKTSKGQIAISLEELDDNERATGLSTIERATGLSTVERATGSSNELVSSSTARSEDINAVLENVLASDNTGTALVLEVIGSMCDGQHRILQNYLRDQPDNLKTVNVVAEVANFLHTYAGFNASENLGQIHQILQSLIEMCVGNIENQLVILDKLVVEPLNRILQLPLPGSNGDCTSNESTDCEYLIELVEVKGSAVELISVLLEEISPQTAKVAQSVGSTLDEEAIITTIEFFRTLRSNSVICKNEMDDDCERGMFRAYNLLLALIDFGESSFNSIKDIKKSTQSNKAKDAINECANHTRTIEIRYQSEDSSCKPMLVEVNFQYDSQDTLREDLSEKVRWNINRDSMEDKQRALLDLMPALKRDINHQKKLKQTKILRPILAYHTLRVYILMFVTLVLNLFVLFTYSVPIEKQDIDDNSFLVYPDTPVWFYQYVLFVLGGVHLLLSFWIVVEYFLINWPHFQLPQFVYQFWYRLVQSILREQNFRQLPHFTFVNVNIFGVPTVYMIVFLACSMLSLAFRGYFYSVCLLFIIFTSDILKRVLRAVTKHGSALIWVAVLGVIILFIYAVISFAWLHSYFTPTEGQFCDSLSQCFYSVVRIGLLDTLGTSIPLNSTGETTSFTSNLSLRLIYDLSFFVIITTIGLNIVFGIIVDSFGELREERSNIETEQKKRCFVCDLPSYDFERKAKGFRNHIKLDHNMWNYVYYSVYIDRIDTADHNAIQKYVYEKIADNDTGFFPQEEARCFAGDDDTTTQKLDELHERIEEILQQFKNKEHKKNLLAKKINQMKFEADLKAGQNAGL